MTLLYEGKNIVKMYKSDIALNLPDFYLNTKELLLLAGPNGSGKSTLLRLLAFLEYPTSGELHYFGDKAHPRRNVTLLLQESYLFNDSVFRNVTLGLILRGETKKLKKDFTEAMQLAGFSQPEKFANRRPRALSGGEKQRVALASRLIIKPKVLLLDEPTTFVDAESSRIIISALKYIRTQGTTIVCATHDRNLMETEESRILELSYSDNTPSF